MTPDIAANGLMGLVAVAAIILFWMGPLHWFAVDWARERMFTARDRLFDAAAEGKVRFDNPSYMAIRTRINDNIRFAHYGTITRFMVHHWFSDNSFRRLPLCSIREEIDCIDGNEARSVAHGALDEVEFASLALVVVKSPFTSATLAAYFLPRYIRGRVVPYQPSGWRGWVRTWADRLQAEMPTVVRIRH